METGPLGRFHKINANGLHPLEQVLVDRERDVVFRVRHIGFLRLIQSQTQPGPASPGLQEDTHCPRPLLLLQEVLNHSSRSFRDFKHTVSL